MSRGKTWLENVRVYYGHPIFQQPKEENLQEQDPLGPKVSDTKICLNDTIITTRRSNLHHNATVTTRLDPPIPSYLV
jgi:hypothetical protein